MSKSLSASLNRTSAEFSATVRVQHSVIITCPRSLETVVHYYANNPMSTSSLDVLAIRIIAKSSMERLSYGEWAEVEGTGGSAFNVVADLLRPIRDSTTQPQANSELTVLGRVCRLMDHACNLVVVEVLEGAGSLYFGLERTSIPEEELEWILLDHLAHIQGAFAALRLHPEDGSPILTIMPSIAPEFTPPVTGDEEELLYPYGVMSNPIPNEEPDDHQVDLDPSISDKLIIGSPIEPILEVKLPSGQMAFHVTAPSIAEDHPRTIVAPTITTSLPPAQSTLLPPQKRAYIRVRRAWKEAQVGCGDHDVGTDADVEIEDSRTGSPSSQVFAVPEDLASYPSDGVTGKIEYLDLPYAHPEAEDCFSEASVYAFDGHRRSPSPVQWQIFHPDDQVTPTPGFNHLHLPVAHTPPEVCYSEVSEAVAGVSDDQSDPALPPDVELTPTEHALPSFPFDDTDAYTERIEDLGLSYGPPYVEDRPRGASALVVDEDQRSSSQGDGDRTPTQDRWQTFLSDNKVAPIPEFGDPYLPIAPTPPEECFSEGSAPAIDNGGDLTSNDSDGGRTPTQNKRPLFLPEDDATSAAAGGSSLRGTDEHSADEDGRTDRSGQGVSSVWKDYVEASVNSSEEALSADTDERSSMAGYASEGRGEPKNRSDPINSPPKRGRPYSDSPARNGSPKRQRRRSD